MATPDGKKPKEEEEDLYSFRDNNDTRNNEDIGLSEPFVTPSYHRRKKEKLSQQGRQWRERKCPIFETVPKGIRTPAHLSASPAFYH